MGMVNPYYQDESVTLHLGDALEVAQTLPAGSADCIVTSPPYFGLRDYGSEGQYGLEASPAEYVDRMRGLFSELRRALADDGTLWLNLGDSYATKPKGSADNGTSTLANGRYNQHGTTPPGLGKGIAWDVPQKNLLGIPWRVAFALQDDDSGDIYELRADAPECLRSAPYLEACRIRTPRNESGTTASTPSVGGKPILSDTPNGEPHGTQPMPTSSADTAASTTSCTASKRSSDKFAATSVDTDDSDSQLCSTTAASNPSAPAAESGGFHSSPSTTSAAAATSTESNSAQSASTSGNTCGESRTPKGSECSATTATAQSATTANARTKRKALRIRKGDIPPNDLQYFSLVKQERWILRNAVIWQKPNAMPESVTDRLSGRYEHVFLFSKQQRYWFDLDPIREPTITDHSSTPAANWRDGALGHAGKTSILHRCWKPGDSPAGRNPGDVWSIPTQPFPGAHFAVFPVALPQRCILAGCKPGGTVLDPFNGSGTTGLAAQKTGRKYIGIDINAEYLDLTLKTRLRQSALDFEVGA